METSKQISAERVSQKKNKETYAEKNGPSQGLYFLALSEPHKDLMEDISNKHFGFKGR